MSEKEKAKEDVRKLDIGLSLKSLLKWIDTIASKIEALTRRVEALEANLKEAKETEHEEEEEW